MKKIAKFILLCTAFTPLLVNENYIAKFIDAKVLFLRGVSFAAIFLISCIILFKNKDRLAVLERLDLAKKDSLFIALTINILLISLGTFFAFDKEIAFFGEPIRAEGLLTLITIYAIYVGFYLLFNKKDWTRFFVATIFSTTILFIVQLVQFASGIERSYSLIGNPVFLANYYLFSTFSGYYVLVLGSNIKKSAYSYLGAFGIIISIIGIFLTKTRGAIFAVFVALLVCSIVSIIYGKGVYFKKISIRKIGLFMAILALSFTGLFIATRKVLFWQQIPGLDRVAEVSIGKDQTSSRLEYTKASLDGFVHNQSIKQTLFGWGQSNYKFFWIKNYQADFFYYDPKTADHAHNQLIDILVMSGILGLASYGFVWFFYVKKVFKFMKQNLILCLGIIFWSTSYFLSNLFSFDIAVTLLAFYVMLSLISSLSENYYEKQI
jgi:O-antigen ligase